MMCQFTPTVKLPPDSTLTNEEEWRRTPANCIMQRHTLGGKCYLPSSTYMSSQMHMIDEYCCDWNDRESTPLLHTTANRTASFTPLHPDPGWLWHHLDLSLRPNHFSCTIQELINPWRWSVTSLKREILQPDMKGIGPNNSLFFFFVSQMQLITSFTEDSKCTVMIDPLGSVILFCACHTKFSSWPSCMVFLQTQWLFLGQSFNACLCCCCFFLEVCTGSV